MDYVAALKNHHLQAEGGIDAFDTVEAAPEFTVLPPGVYKARVLRGEYKTTKDGAEAYRILFEVVEGPYEGQIVGRTWTFGAKALPYTKRDLTKLGLSTKVQLLSPFPEFGHDYIVQLVVVRRCDDNGTEWNDVKRIEVIDIEETPAARYAIPIPPPEEAI